MSNDKTRPLTWICSIAPEWLETNGATMAETEVDVASTEQPHNDNANASRETRYTNSM